MVHPRHKGIMACILALSMALTMVGCAGKPMADMAMPQNVILSAAQPAVNDSQAVLDYLKASRDDLALIDEIIADQDLGLLEEDSDTEEEITDELFAKYQGVLTGYTDRIQAVLNGIDARTTPNHPDVVNLKNAEKAEFQLLDDILDEYLQALLYSQTIIHVTDNITNLDSTQQDDLQSMYDAYSTEIGNAIKSLQDSDVPSFLKSTNDDFINALQQMDDAVLYALNAVAMEDPMRSDAADYRMGILARHFEKISTEWDLDLTKRENKLRTDSQDVKKTCDGLRNWLDSNITHLGGN